MMTVISVVLMAALTVYFVRSYLSGEQKGEEKSGGRRRAESNFAETVMINEMRMEVLNPMTGKVAEEIPLGPITQKGVLIGRSSLCDVVVGNATVSRKHCLLRQDKTGLILEDVGSSQGIFDSGERKQKKRSIRIEPGRTYYMANVPIRIFSSYPVVWSDQERETGEERKEHRDKDIEVDRRSDRGRETGDDRRNDRDKDTGVDRRNDLDRETGDKWRTVGDDIEDSGERPANRTKTWIFNRRTGS